MQVDKDTLHDLSIFNSDESVSIFNYLNQTGTVGGKEMLRYLVEHPLGSIEKIKDAQAVIKALANTLPNWPSSITNGTIMVVAKYYETQFDPYPQHPTYFNSNWYKIFHAPDYALTKYTITHCIDFLKGMFAVHQLLLDYNQHPIASRWTESIEKKLSKPALASLRLMDIKTATPQQILSIAGQIRRRHKQDFYDLIDLYSAMDAYQSLARVFVAQDLCFPNFTTAPIACIAATNCYHPL